MWLIVYVVYYLLIGWLVGWLAGWLVRWSVRWSVRWLAQVFDVEDNGAHIDNRYQSSLPEPIREWMECMHGRYVVFQIATCPPPPRARTTTHTHAHEIMVYVCITIAIGCRLCSKVVITAMMRNKTGVWRRAE